MAETGCCLRKAQRVVIAASHWHAEQWRIEDGRLAVILSVMDGPTIAQETRAVVVVELTGWPRERERML